MYSPYLRIVSNLWDHYHREAISYLRGCGICSNDDQVSPGSQKASDSDGSKQQASGCQQISKHDVEREALNLPLSRAQVSGVPQDQTGRRIPCRNLPQGIQRESTVNWKGYKRYIDILYLLTYIMLGLHMIKVLITSSEPPATPIAITNVKRLWKLVSNDMIDATLFLTCACSLLMISAFGITRCSQIWKYRATNLWPGVCKGPLAMFLTNRTKASRLKL